MSRLAMRLPFLPFLPLALVILSILSRPAWAADQKATAAELNLSFDSKGYVSIYFVVFVLPEKPTVLESVIFHALGVKLRDVGWDIDDHKHVVSMYAQTGTPFPHDLLSVKGTIDLTPVRQLLRELQINSFQVRVTHPLCGFSEFSSDLNSPQAQGSVVEYLCRPPVGQTNSLPQKFAFGFRNSDLYRFAFPLLALVLLPAGVMTGAWAAQAKRMNWNVASLSRLVVVQAVGVWFLGFITVYVLHGDLLSWFMLGFDSALARVASVSFLLLLAPAVAVLLSLILVRRMTASESISNSSGLDPLRKDSRHDKESDFPMNSPRKISASLPGQLRLWFTAGDLLFRMELTLVLPTILLGTAILDLRESNNAHEWAWLSAGILATIVALGLFGWVHANALQLGGAAMDLSPDQARLNGLARKIRVRIWYAQLWTAVCLPAVLIVSLRAARLEDATRYAVLAGGVALCVVLFVFARRRIGIPKEAALSGAGGRPKKGIGITALGLGVLIVLASGVCVLLHLPFDLSNGDEGWAMLLMTGTIGLLSLFW